MVTGTPIFSALVIAKIEVDFTGTAHSMKAIAVYVNTDTGQSHGSTTASGQEWSQETLKRLTELRQSMEEDMAAKHFARDSVNGRAKPGLQMPTGLSEHLDGDAPSV